MAASRSSTSPELEARVAARLRRSVPPGAALVVALSGGRDSVALLELAQAAAAALGLRLSALHVNHGLSPNADAWVRFCSELCAALAVPLRVVAVRVEQRPGEGLEAAARRARYAAFAGADGDFIALAHHADDQAETLLFRLLRGSGVGGAAGMPAARELVADGAGPRLIRPLLGVPAAQLAEYVAARGRSHIDDESNADLRHARNFVRHRLLAPAEARFPGAGERLAAAATRFAEAGELLADLARIDAAACAGDRGLRVAGLAALPPARQRNLLYGCLRQAGIAVRSAAWLDEVLRQVLAGRRDAQPCLPVGSAAIHVWRGELVLVEEAGGPPPEPRAWCQESSLAWAGGSVDCLAGVGDGLAQARCVGRTAKLMPRAGGEFLRPDPRRPRRSLKHCWQALAVPPWERAIAPCLWIDGALAWVGGVGVDQKFAAAAGEASWRLSWRPFSRDP